MKFLQVVCSVLEELATSTFKAEVNRERSYYMRADGTALTVLTLHSPIFILQPIAVPEVSQSKLCVQFLSPPP
jgi:hypothetical protein